MPAWQRMNFSEKVKDDALTRAAFKCEGELASGERCAVDLVAGYFAFDHIIPDNLGGRPTLDNCQVLCKDCHRAKTAVDRRVIDHVKRVVSRHLGLRSVRKPMAGSRFSSVTKAPGGPTRDRTTGLVRSRTASIDVRDL